jgi:hypothetical protein
MLAAAIISGEINCSIAKTTDTMKNTFLNVCNELSKFDDFSLAEAARLTLEQALFVTAFVRFDAS